MVVIFKNAPWQAALGSIQEVPDFLATGSLTDADHLQTVCHSLTGSILFIYRK